MRTQPAEITLERNVQLLESQSGRRLSLHIRLRKVKIMPIEDGMRKATENLDEAAGAAPTSKELRTDDPEQRHAEDHNEDEVAKQNEAEAPHDESDDD